MALSPHRTPWRAWAWCPAEDDQLVGVGAQLGGNGALLAPGAPQPAVGAHGSRIICPS